MSIWDSIKKFTQPYAEEDYDEYDDEELDEYEDEVAEQPAPRTGRRMPQFGGAPAAEAPEAPADSAPQAAATGAAAFTAPAASETPFSGNVVAMGSTKDVVLFHAETFDDAAKAGVELRRRRAVILNMENVDKALARRVVDFLSGCTFALEGSVKKVAQATYLFCPHGMNIIGDLENIQAESDSYV